jgi:putative iron-regulated protein
MTVTEFHSATHFAGPLMPRGVRSILALAIMITGFSQTRAATVLNPRSNAPPETLRRAVANHYAEIVSATYQDALAAAQALKCATDSFLLQPSEQKLEATRAAWRAARVPYSQSEAFRF